MARTDPSGKTAPSGGFQTGGWYSGYQYWEGSFAPTAGTIHPSSDQPGAGGEAYVAPKDVAYIAAQREAGPQSAEEVTPYLNQYQGDVYKAADRPEVRQPTMEEIKAATQPALGLPDPIKRAERFEELRTEYGVAALEESLISIKDDIEAEYNLLREQRGLEEGKPVALNVIAGRISEEERTAQERIDFLGRQQNRIVDELNIKYNVIGQYMDFYSLDYQDAVARYDKEFSRNIDMYKLILGQEDKALGQWNADRAAASSNLTMYMNAATSGNIEYSGLSASQKLQISKLEVQAGLPIGFMASVKKDADADIIFQTTNKGVTQIGIRNADGSVSVESYGTPTPDEPTDSETKKEIFGEVQTELDRLGGSDKYVSPEEWKYLKTQWISFGYSASTFDEAFRSTYVNPDFSESDFGLGL